MKRFPGHSNPPPPPRGKRLSRKEYNKGVPIATVILIDDKGNRWGSGKDANGELIGFRVTEFITQLPNL